MKKITILTGAGISAESGIQTFRDSNGLWENYAIEDVATPEAWKKKPLLVQEFYNHRRKQVLESQVNKAHLFLKELEKEYEVTIITQNIDDLHERAGSSFIIHLHGLITLAKSSGPNSEKKYYPIEGWELKKEDKCDDGFLLRPHVVWFGEDVPMMEKASQICQDADLLIVIGTSLQVYPAAGLIYACKKECKKIIVDPNLNESILNSSEFIYIQKSAVESIDFLKIEIKKAFQN